MTGGFRSGCPCNLVSLHFATRNATLNHRFSRHLPDSAGKIGCRGQFDAFLAHGEHRQPSFATW
jgi:hypothetical protein